MQLKKQNAKPKLLKAFEALTNDTQRQRILPNFSTVIDALAYDNLRHCIHKYAQSVVFRCSIFKIDTAATSKVIDM